MLDKKKSESKKTPEQEALERHVDAMMDPKQPDEVPTGKVPEPAVANPKITAVAAPVSPDAQIATTAPQLSPKLRKQIAVAGTPAKPLSIDKLDELTKSITEAETPKKSKKFAKSKAQEEPETEEPAPEEPALEAAEDDIAEQSTDLEDTQTDKAVDDIMAYESDVMLAVADSTAEERSRQAEVTPEHKGHPVVSMIFWSVVALVVILIIALSVLLFMGDSLTSKLGL